MTEIIHNFSIPKSAFLALPEPEQQLLVLVGRSVNDIILLRSKFDALASDLITNPATNYVNRTKHAELNLLLRILCGTLHESRDFVNKKNFSLIIRSINTHLPDEAKSAKKYIDGYFPKTNSLSSIRNHFAFHLDKHILDGRYTFARSKAAEKMESFDFSVGENPRRELIWFAEEYSALVMAHAFVGDEGEPTFKRVFNDMMLISDKFYIYFSHLLGELLRSRFPQLRIR